MSDENLDRMVRDADPYRADLAGRLGGAEQTLLEEIMSTPRLASVPVPQKSLARRLAPAVAAAAAVTTVIGAGALLSDRGAEKKAPPVALPTSSTEASGYQFDLVAAAKLPRLLIDQPGWKITVVYGFGAERGTIQFVDGDRSIEMNWNKADQYQASYDKRTLGGKPSAATVAGTPATVTTYGDGVFAALVKPRDGVFVDVRTDPGWTRDGFTELLGRVKRVDAAAFLAAMPPEVVTPGKVRTRVREVLADVPIPPGFDVAAVRVDGANDPYQFGAAVTGRVTCAWIVEHIRADKAGDEAATERAAAALRSSTRWRALDQMVGEGAYPEVLRQIAGQVAAGGGSEGYRGALGCDG